MPKQPREWVSVAAVLVGLATFTACGVARAISPPPPPQFTSTPPAFAVEGSVYTYEITAVDPSGSAVTLDLTTGPTGAVLKGRTLTWTPAPNQSRTQNRFTIRATTRASATASQSWSVSPAGTIHGSYVDTFWNTNGSQVRANDLSPAACSWCSFAALVPQPDGSVRELPGTGNTDGAFTIPNVPAGHYWLRISSDPPRLFWTDTSTFALGQDYVGRVSGPVSSTFDINLAGLNPWQSQDSLRILSPNAGSELTLVNSPAIGSTSFTDSEQLSVPPIDPPQGDVTFVWQNEPLLLPSLSGQAIGPALTFPDLTVTAGGHAIIAGTLTFTPRTFDLSFVPSVWISQFADTGPAPATLGVVRAGLYVQPILTDRKVPLIILFEATGSTNPDQVYGVVQYGDPFPSEWARVFSVKQVAAVEVPLPGGGTQKLPVASGHETTEIPASPVSPLMSPVQNPTVNGASFFSSHTTATPSITLRWLPPTGLRASGYVIEILQLQMNNGLPCYSGPMAFLYSADIAITVPSTLLAANSTYLFRIQARADSRMNMERSPFEAGFPVAFADSISGPVTISGGTPAHE